MSKILVLAEKPSVGRDIARVLNCKKKGNGCLEGDKYIVTWAMGHLVTLADPEKYGDQYKSWKLEDLPIIPPQMKLEVIKKTSKQYNAVKSLMKRGDVKEIIIATDAGREGELVARWIIAKAGVKKPIKRLWISSVTDKAIRDGFNNLKDGKAYENLYRSAVARSEADWVVGINGTRALTCKHNAQLSCGRVQTPTIAMIAMREDEIRNFVPQKYYGLGATAKGVKFTWRDSKNNARSFNKEKIDGILKALNGQAGEVIKVDKVSKKKHPPQLYDLTTLQRDANSRFGYSAKETLSIMQRLYETHKVLTYPRTDSKYITSDVVGTLKDRLKGCSTGPYTKLATRILRNPIKANKSFVDDKKVSDHHAIIPTEESVYLGDLTDRERKIYDLVVKRFLAALFPPYEYEQMTVTLKIGSETFAAKGNAPKVMGWKEVYDNHFDDEDEDDVPEQNFPEMKQGQSLKISNLVQTKGETKPPARFNEGTLLGAMENPKKYMQNQSKDLMKTIDETGGLGTVATRADIIEKLFNTYLIEKRGNDIHITSKGKQLLKLVPKDLQSPTLTAEWEQKLSAIAKGNLNKDKFIGEMKDYAKVIVEDIKKDDTKFKHDNMTKSKCPDCGKFLLEVSGKKGKMLVCQDRECGYRKGISRVTNARCPNCHKKMEMRGEGEGKLFACKCGYREKLSSFEKRKKESGNKMSNRDAAKYLAQEKKKNEEEVFNPAMAEALKKLGLK